MVVHFDVHIPISFETTHLYLQQMNIEVSDVCSVAKQTFGKYVQSIHFCFIAPRPLYSAKTIFAFILHKPWTSLSIEPA
jgi:hypothetical protein